MSQVNFKIVENYSHEHKFEDFKKDYVNGMPMKQLMKKHDITKSVWKEWKQRVPRRSQFREDKPRKTKKLKKNFSDHFFRKTYRDNVTVFRRVDGGHYSYGSYPDMETAEMVCDKLVENNWDKQLALELLEEYAVPNSVRTLYSRMLRREFDADKEM